MALSCHPRRDRGAPSSPPPRRRARRRRAAARRRRRARAASPITVLDDLRPGRGGRGPYWGRPPCHRCTTASTGSTRSPVTSARSVAGRPRRVRRRWRRRARRPPNRPNEARTSAPPRSARCGHLRLDSVKALARNGFPGRDQDAGVLRQFGAASAAPARRRPTRPAGPAAAAALATGATSDSSAASDGAGTASTTPSTRPDRIDPPARRRRSRGQARRDRRATHRRRARFRAARRAARRSRRASPPNTGPGIGSGIASATAADRLAAPRSSAAASGRQRRAHADRVRQSRVDAAEQRVHRAARPPARRSGHRPASRRRCPSRAASAADDRGSASIRRQGLRVDQSRHRLAARRDSHQGAARAAGAARPRTRSAAAHPGRRDDLVGQAELGEQRRHLGPPRDERLRAHVDRAARRAAGPQLAADPADSSTRVIVGVGTEHAAQPVRGDQAGDAPTDDGDGVSQRVHQLHHRGQHARIGVREHAVAEVEDVAGRAGRERPVGLGARSGGPRVRRRPRPRRAPPGRGCPAAPCRGRRDGRPRRAGSASRRRPRRRPTSPMTPSSSPVPTPKWMRGTPASATSARTRSECGSTNSRYSASDSAPAQESNSCTASTPACSCACRNAIVVSAIVPSSACQVLRVRVHQRLGALVVAAGPALDQVGGEGERRPGEADQRGVAELPGQQRDRPR